MTIVVYKILTPAGKIETGELIVSTPEEALKNFRSKECVVLKCQKKRQWFSRKISLTDLADLCFHLAAFDRAGLPVLDGLTEALALNWKKSIQKILKEIIEQVRSGVLLSQALKQQISAHPLLASLIQIAEKTGKFHPYFSQAEQHCRWQHDIQQTVRQALRYPAILMFFLSVLLVITTTILVPNLEDHLKILGVNTQSLMTTSLIVLTEVIQQFGAFFLVFLSIGTLSVLIIRRFSESFDRAISRSFLSIPMIGDIWKNLDFIQFFQHLSVMLQNKIEIIPSIHQSVETLKNRWIRYHLSHLSDQLIKGQSLSQALATIPQLPPYLLRYVQLGENTGDLPTILHQACHHQLADIKKRITHVTSWIQPCLVIFMGSLLIWIILAILVPLYDSIHLMDI